MSHLLISRSDILDRKGSVVNLELYKSFLKWWRPFKQSLMASRGLICEHCHHPIIPRTGKLQTPDGLVVHHVFGGSELL